MIYVLYSQNKPKFMLPDLIGGSFVIFILIVSILVIPEIVIAYIEETGLLATQKGVIILRITFFTWIFLSIFTGLFNFEKVIIIHMLGLHQFHSIDKCLFHNNFRCCHLLYDRSLLSVHGFNRRWI